ncbi:MAG: AAA family ATPase, partial [Flammeovirgaceae bacterium]|nr:AAA family ATPase [Flammeovirgaceae bacterium]MDW8288818.1 AAA family ATPase [Flammeovirgaceae bacterium]
MAKIIAMSNHKGGVGKTTSTLNIGAGLANLGKRVLLIDLDPQANLSQSLGIREPKKSIYGVLRNFYPISETILTMEGNYDLIPSELDLSGAEVELSSEAGREFILREQLETIR